MTKTLRNAVVVITGASSGIGRATAREFARQGAIVVLAARRENLLLEAARECRELGSPDTLTVPTNVTDEEAVRELAQRTIERFAHIDVWVNNAGVALFGRFEETPAEAFRRVIETNLFGEVYGARAVLPYFREQGHGVLINNASMLSQLGAPYYTAYAASKFAIRGFSESLREELNTLDGTDIQVCTVMPATIDTPLFQHAANYTGRPVQALPPVYDVEQAARAIVRLAARPQREIFIGNMARMQSTMHTLAPALTEPIMARQVDTLHFKHDGPASRTDGNIFEPMQEGSDASGGWKQPATSADSARNLALVTAGAVMLASAAFSWLWLRKK
jgi:short-subunit dehydrogenase